MRDYQRSSHKYSKYKSTKVKAVDISTFLKELHIPIECNNVTKLNIEMASIGRKLIPRPEEMEMRNFYIKKMQKVIFDILYPIYEDEFVVLPFGSSSSGLNLPSADIDLVILPTADVFASEHIDDAEKEDIRKFFQLKDKNNLNDGIKTKENIKRNLNLEREDVKRLKTNNELSNGSKKANTYLRNDSKAEEKNKFYEDDNSTEKKNVILEIQNIISEKESITGVFDKGTCPKASDDDNNKNYQVLGHTSTTNGFLCKTESLEFLKTKNIEDSEKSLLTPELLAEKKDFESDFSKELSDDDFKNQEDKLTSNEEKNEIKNTKYLNTNINNDIFTKLDVSPVKNVKLIEKGDCSDNKSEDNHLKSNMNIIGDQNIKNVSKFSNLNKEVFKTTNSSTRSVNNDNTHRLLLKNNTSSPRFSNMAANTILATVAIALKKTSFIDKNTLFHIKTARTPIIKCRDLETRLEFDICFNTCNILQHNKFIKDEIKKRPYIKNFCLILKLFLEARNLTLSRNGGLCSFAQFLLVSHFCKLHPMLQTFNMNPLDNLGVLFLDFFQLYGIIFPYNGITIDTISVSYTKQQISNSILSLQDPANSTRDAGDNCSNMFAIAEVFQHAYLIMIEEMKNLPIYNASLLSLWIPQTKALQVAREKFSKTTAKKQ